MSNKVSVKNGAMLSTVVNKKHERSKTKMNIGERIKNLRLERNMTAIELAQRVGVARSMISQIERGSRTLSVPLAIEISKVLEVPLFELILT